jgi:hypothetical protein
MSGPLRSLLVLAAAMACAAVSRAGEPQPPVDVSSVADRVLAAQPGDSLLLVIGDRITSARIDRGGLTSRGATLRLVGTHVRGQVGGQRVQLEMRAAHINGEIGASEVSLEVGRLDGALKVTGRFGACAVSEELTPGAVTADIGPCRYVLKFQHMEYTGQVNCGGQPEPVHLRVPASLVARSDVELAALFTALLSR